MFLSVFTKTLAKKICRQRDDRFKSGGTASAPQCPITSDNRRVGTKCMRISSLVKKIPVALEAAEQQAHRAIRYFQPTAAPIRNACALLAR